ncbi:MAG: DUF4342 domain-containing protein [Anaerolineae bacterium]|nr:DUF4342 domain-containing protein [Anaerolineae bacterium]
MAEEKDKRAPESEPERPFTDQLEVAGEELVERVKELVKQGNIRKLIIKSADGRILLQLPLTLGVVVSGGLLFFYPILAMLTAIGGLVARVHIEIVREEEGDVVTEMDLDSQDVTRKAEEFVNDVSKRLERAGKPASSASTAGKQKIDLDDAEETDNNLQA